MSDPTPVSPLEDEDQTSTVFESGDEATVSMSQEKAKCLWNGTEFNPGDRISTDGAVYECNYGCWVKVES